MGTSTDRFVYGLRIRGLDHVTELPAAPGPQPAPAPAPAGEQGGPVPVPRTPVDASVPAGQDVPVLVRQTPHPPSRPTDFDPVHGGVRELTDGRLLTLDRDRGCATFHGPALPADLLAHPYLGPVATVFNRWAGRETFHAGAFVLDGRAWVVLGPRNAGKSSLLAALHARGTEVVSDDIVVVDELAVRSGPRCVDLRQPVPGIALDTRTVRAGSRARVGLPPVAARTPLAGWLFLHWGSRLTLDPVPGAELLGRLAARRSWPHLPSDPVALLAMAALPGWDLTRPPDWRGLGATCRLLRTLADSPHRDLVNW